MVLFHYFMWCRVSLTPGMQASSFILSLYFCSFLGFKLHWVLTIYFCHWLIPIFSRFPLNCLVFTLFCIYVYKYIHVWKCKEHCRETCSWIVWSGAIPWIHSFSDLNFIIIEIQLEQVTWLIWSGYTVEYFMWKCLKTLKYCTNGPY